MAKSIDTLEIRWCGKNRRALKKIYAMDYYPGIPVITTDDDIIVKEDFVESFMEAHRQHPGDAIYAHMWDFPANRDVKISGWARLFPPHSLYPLDVKLFDRFFGGAEDDVWNAIRVLLAGTGVRKLGKWPFVDQVPIGDTAFYRVYSRIDPSGCYKRLMEYLGKHREAPGDNLGTGKGDKVCTL